MDWYWPAGDGRNGLRCCVEERLGNLEICDITSAIMEIGKGNVTSRSGPTQRARAIEMLKTRGLLRLKDFAAEGIGPETLARLVRASDVIRPTRGLYQLSDTPVSAEHILVEASVLIPKGIVCLTSALQYHDLTLQMPSAVWMAIDRAAWRPRSGYPTIRFVRFSGNALTDDIERYSIEGVDVPITGPARTIIDCFRYRNKVGLDVAMEGLREGLRSRKATPDQLWTYAKATRSWSTVKPYLEAMTSGA